jgi:hypothetical protein
MAELVPFNRLMDRADTAELATRLFGLGDGSTPDFIAKFLAVTMMCTAASPEQDLYTPARNPSTPPEHLGYARDSAVVYYVQLEHETGVYAPWVCTVALGASVSFGFYPSGDPSQVMYQDDSWTIAGAELLPAVANGDGTVRHRAILPNPPQQAQTQHLGWEPATHAMLARSLWLPVRDALRLGH